MELLKPREKLIEELENYILRTRRSREVLKTSIKVSARDLGEDVVGLAKKPSASELFRLAKDSVGSAAWIANSYLQFLSSSIGRKKKVYGNIDDLDGQYIVRKVAQNIRIDPREYSPQQIFNAIYRELDYSHHHPKYVTPLQCPRIFPTIVLISGVLNEIYKTAAFERGVEHLSKETGLRYHVVKTHGLRSVKHNAKLIKEQLKKYSQENPDEKLWIIAYSKGGVDSLHFLADDSEWASTNLAGISTIASPILGSQHLDHKLLKIINNLGKVKDTKLYEFLDKNWDFLAQEFQNSISHRTQKPWFRRNYHRLPGNIFYTALALESEWYESHIYMILTKIFFPSKNKNDGIVDSDHALFPDYFHALNLGIIQGHHLIGARSSSYSQEALISAHIIFLKYLNYV